jgi:hypothetical protein
LTPLTVKTLPELLRKINQWNLKRKVYHYQNSVNGIDHHMAIDVFGDIFTQDFDLAIGLKSTQTPEEIASRNYLVGIAQQSAHGGPRPKQIHELFDFLNTMDQRRNTSWPQTFPWLIAEFTKYGLVI